MANKLLLCLLLILGCIGGGISLSAQSPLDSLEQLARQWYRADLDSSRAYADQVQQAAAATDNHEKFAWALNWKAICFLKNGRSDSVAHYLDRCITYCEAHGVPEVEGKARLNQSINALQTGDYEASAEMGLAALAHFESIDDTLGIAHAHYNTGLSYQRMQRMDAAQDFYYKALPTYQERGGILDRANTLNAIGTVWKYRGDLDSALYYHQAAVDVKLAVNAWAYCGSEYSNMASIYEDWGDAEQAQTYYERAFRAFEAIGDVRGKATVACNLSDFQYQAARWDSAIYYGEIGLQYADTTDDRFLMSKNHRRLARAYEAIGDYERAFYHDQIRDSLQILLTSAEVQKNMDELHIQYETVKRDKELAEEKVKSQRKTFWLMGSIGGILALLVGFVLWLRSEREKKRRLVAQGRASLESERNRISMDLHDHLGAELSILTAHLDTQAFRVKDPRVSEDLEALADQTREASAQLRETIWSVRSPEITTEQFGVKVREFAQRLLATSPIEFHLVTQGQTHLGPAVALDLFRVVQEAIHNAYKYSGGTTIDMAMTASEKFIHITVTDDGKGFEPAPSRDSYGLTNMEERVTALGGTYALESDFGTRITIDLPLKA